MRLTCSRRGVACRQRVEQRGRDLGRLTLTLAGMTIGMAEQRGPLSEGGLHAGGLARSSVTESVGISGPVSLLTEALVRACLPTVPALAVVIPLGCEQAAAALTPAGHAAPQCPIPACPGSATAPKSR
jgi:hypothetical protein